MRGGLRCSTAEDKEWLLLSDISSTKMWQNDSLSHEFYDYFAISDSFINDVRV